MDWNHPIVAFLLGWVPAVVVLVVSVVALPLTARVLEQRRARVAEGASLRHQLAMLALTGAAVIAFVLAIPIDETSRGQLLGLLGLLLSAAIALSSTTFVGNALAGVMLRAVKNFRGGDFIHVGEFSGRVSERGLLHVEIQTEDRDLTTLPNLYLVTNPVKVVRASGTLISAQVSLGYDVPHRDAERLLAEAAETAGLTDAFVQVSDLLDHAVVYRTAGFLDDVRTLLSARSRLRAAMLDGLHGAGIEIVSPSFMNQRPLDPAAAVIPEVSNAADEPAASDEPAQALVFDKAELAATREGLATELAEIVARIGELEGAAPSGDADQAERNAREVDELERRRLELVEQVSELADAEPG